MDKFHEQLLKTQKNALYRVLTVYMYISIFMIVMTASVAVTGLQLRLLIVTVIFIGAYILGRIMRDKQYREFEYIFTNGNLQIDVIYNMKKRKVLYDVDIKDLEEFGKSEEVKLAKETKKVICYPWNSKGEKYTMIVNKDGRQAVFITPNEDLLKLIRIYVRRPR